MQVNFNLLIPNSPRFFSILLFSYTVSIKNNSRSSMKISPVPHYKLWKYIFEFFFTHLNPIISVKINLINKINFGLVIISLKFNAREMNNWKNRFYLKRKTHFSKILTVILIFYFLYSCYKSDIFSGYYQLIALNLNFIFNL